MWDDGASNKVTGLGGVESMGWDGGQGFWSDHDELERTEKTSSVVIFRCGPWHGMGHC